jgi:aminopeptidase N
MAQVRAVAAVAQFAQLGWENRDGDSAQVKQLRARLIGTLGTLGDQNVVAEARRRFAAFQADPASLSPDMRRTVLGIVARNADAALWDQLHAMAKKETSSMIRDQYYSLLAAPKDEALAKRALDMALTDEPGATNSAGMISSVSREHPELAFDFAVAHREQVDTLVDSTSRARYYRCSAPVRASRKWPTRSRPSPRSTSPRARAATRRPPSPASRHGSLRAQRARRSMPG